MTNHSGLQVSKIQNINLPMVSQARQAAWSVNLIAFEICPRIGRHVSRYAWGNPNGVKALGSMHGPLSLPLGSPALLPSSRDVSALDPDDQGLNFHKMQAKLILLVFKLQVSVYVPATGSVTNLIGNVQLRHTIHPHRLRMASVQASLVSSFCPLLISSTCGQVVNSWQYVLGFPAGCQK